MKLPGGSGDRKVPRRASAGPRGPGEAGIAPPAIPGLYGVMAEFDNPTDLLAATRRAYAEGYREVDAFSPFPIEELAEALGVRHTRLPLAVLVGGVIGCIGGYLLQYYAAVIDYPVNVGGRPFHSWPSFVPVTFELTILVAAVTAVLGMLGANGLPQPYHPVFNAPNFALATRDCFFLCIKARDPMFDRQGTARFLAGLGAKLVSEVVP